MKEINLDRILKELQVDTKEALEKTAKDVAKKGVADLKSTSPKRTGKYAQGWRQRKSGDSIVIHNANKPGLTHLLEKGYTTRSGKRVKAYPHIEKVEQSVIENAVKEIEKLLQ